MNSYICKYKVWSLYFIKFHEYKYIINIKINFEKYGRDKAVFLNRSYVCVYKYVFKLMFFPRLMQVCLINLLEN